MSSLLAFDEAFQRLLARAQPLQGIEVVPTMQADGRVLAEPVISMMDIPAWDTSQMDGYAVRAAELEADPDRVFPISQRIPAGIPGLHCARGRSHASSPAPPCRSGPMPWSCRKTPRKCR